MSIHCLKCGYPVTEPLCSSCVVKEVKLWFHGQSLSKKTLKNISHELDALTKKIESIDYVVFPSEDIWEINTKRCSICNNEMHRMCSYCVTMKASEIVTHAVPEKKLVSEFTQSFNTPWYDEINPGINNDSDFEPDEY